MITVFEFVIFHYFYIWLAFDHKTVSPNPNFEYRNQLTCRVVYTTRTQGGLLLPYYDEKTFMLTRLDTNSPGFIRQNGQTWAKYSKQFDVEGYVVLQMEQTEPSFDSDVIGLDKRMGTFVRTIQGTQAGTFQYAISQKGRCE